MVTPENPLSTNENAPGHPPLETETVHSWKVACSGTQNGGLGHPRVWLMIAPETGYVDCGYCDRRFVIDRAHLLDDH
ncbi:MAG: zinc-finger domain-containing protein [Paracoccus sp. (in: a-proteobacteria)]|nr:zinc-finger domain-containing protein [Paracoccus sp. (in: a-proteobacteria)]